MSNNIGFIEKINAIYEKIGAIDTANKSFNKEIVDTLVELKDLDLELIAEDIDKGTFLGNRKIDINLALNMQGITQDILRDNPDLAESTWTDESKTVMYNSCTALFKDGVEITIPFMFDGNATSISTHSDLLLQLSNSIAFKNKLENTTISSFPSLIVGEQLRCTDVAGQASNLDRITLNAVAGDYIEQNPTFYWAKTTSAVEALSMRGGDIIKLGNEIDNILALVNKISEVIDIQAKLPELVGQVGETTIYNKLAELQAVYDKLSTLINVEANEANITGVAAAKPSIDIVANGITSVKNVSDNMDTVLQVPAKTDEVVQIRDELTAINPKVVTLPSNSTPSLSYDKTTGNFTLYMPQGLKGERGEAFNIDASGTIANRTAYDGASQGFAYLSLDESPTKVYFKKSDISGDWTAGVPFGQGEKGEKGAQGISITDISFTSTTDASGLSSQAGATDTYTITFSDTSTHTIQVYNGTDMTNSTLVDDATIDQAKVWSSQKTNNTINQTIEDILFDMKLGLPV